MQWLIGPNENLNLQRIFRGGFPWLEPNEALLEDAFTPESHRGLGIMSCAMAHIAERGLAINARYVITFVHESNIPSLKGCKRAGFVPYKLRREQNFLFHRTISFASLPLGTPYPFDQPTV
jgi:RimJ/RimL family protein N-acetyltransferase